MNIVYIHQHFATARGTTATRTYDFARFLADRGHRVTVVTGVFGSGDVRVEPRGGWVLHQEVEGFSLRVVNVRYDNKQGFWRRIIAFLVFMVVATVEVLRIRDADVVFATSTPLTVGIPGTVAWYVRRVPFVFEVRDIWPESAVAVGALGNPAVVAVARMAERLFYRAARRIIAISGRMADRLRARIGSDGRKLRVIPLGADVRLFDEAKPDHAWRQRSGLQGTFVAVYAGTHGRVNALPQVLEAAAHLRDEPNVRIVLIGDGALKPDLREQVRRRGLTNVVLLNPMPKTQLAGVLKACDMGLMTLENLPVFDTACPNKFMDYLAAGLPVLVNFDGEAGWISEAAGCGIVVPPEDPEAMASAIRDLARAPARAADMGRRARQLAADRFDRRNLIEHFEALLLQAAGGKAKS